MCMIDDCDGRYIQVGVPAGAKTDQCTECRRYVGPEAEVRSFVSSEDLPGLYPFHSLRLTWADWEDVQEWEGDPESPIVWQPEVRVPVDIYGRKVRIRRWSETPMGNDPISLTSWCEEMEGGVPEEIVPTMRINTHVMCPLCKEIRRWLDVVCHGFVFDYVLDEIEQHWDDDWIYHNLAFGKLTLWARARWDRNGKTPTPEEVRDLVSQALPKREAA